MGRAHQVDRDHAGMKSSRVAAVRRTVVRERSRNHVIEPVGSSPAEFAAHMKAETANRRRVVRATGIEPE